LGVSWFGLDTRIIAAQPCVSSSSFATPTAIKTPFTDPASVVIFPHTYVRRAKNAAGEVTALAPIDEMGEHTAVDLTTRFDFFVSTQRAYVLVDGKPHGCVDLPASGVPQGEVTVTFGDVLYHSDADNPLGFHNTYLHYDTERHFDNLGFSSGVPPPSWDLARVPCVPASSIGIHP